MKTCRTCGRMKALDEFYVHPDTADRYLNHCKECVRARVNAHRRRTGDAASRRRKQRHPERRRAVQAVYRAVRSGRLTRGACEVCGSPDVQAHHDDYSLPLQVRWLCSVHHGIEHRILSPK